ncbi:hypothetical protein [Streptomyces sp. NPDC048196]
MRRGDIYLVDHEPVARLLRHIGSVPRRRMAEIDVALRRHLAL